MLSTANFEMRQGSNYKNLFFTLTISFTTSNLNLQANNQARGENSSNVSSALFKSKSSSESLIEAWMRTLYTIHI